VKLALLGVAACALGGAVAFGLVEGPTLPAELSIDLIAKLYEPVRLDHAEHVEIEENCGSCHHRPFGEPEPCASCHEDSFEPSSFGHALHSEIGDCMGCHNREATSDLRCVSCHTVDPNPERLELIGLKGAYHGLCLRCHDETGPDASCGPCHPDREKSRILRTLGVENRSMD
jgi:hypothetical protein